jgi:hypothetical protein
LLPVVVYVVHTVPCRPMWPVRVEEIFHRILYVR